VTGSNSHFLSTDIATENPRSGYWWQQRTLGDERRRLPETTKLIKTTGKVTDNSPLFRIFALTITILYELRLKNESKNTDHAWRHRSSPI